MPCPCISVSRHDYDYDKNMGNAYACKQQRKPKTSINFFGKMYLFNDSFLNFNSGADGNLRKQTPLKFNPGCHNGERIHHHCDGNPFAKISNLLRFKFSFPVMIESTSLSSHTR